MPINLLMAKCSCPTEFNNEFKVETFRIYHFSEKPNLNEGKEMIDLYHQGRSKIIDQLFFLKHIIVFNESWCHLQTTYYSISQERFQPCLYRH